MAVPPRRFVRATRRRRSESLSEGDGSPDLSGGFGGGGIGGTSASLLGRSAPPGVGLSVASLSRSYDDAQFAGARALLTGSDGGPRDSAQQGDYSPVQLQLGFDSPGERTKRRRDDHDNDDDDLLSGVLGTLGVSAPKSQKVWVWLDRTLLARLEDISELRQGLLGFFEQFGGWFCCLFVCLFCCNS
jgi:hypothetical protein